MPYYIEENGKRYDYEQTDITQIPNVYFLMGIRPGDEKGAVYVHRFNKLNPLLSDEGPVAPVPEFAGMNYWHFRKQKYTLEIEFVPGTTEEQAKAHIKNLKRDYNLTNLEIISTKSTDNVPPSTESETDKA